MSKPVAAHLVVSDPGAAAQWYETVFHAQERSRIPLPGERVLTIELMIGETTVALAGEFPDQGIVSPKTLGGTYSALVIDTDDADAMWQRAVDAGATVFHPIGDTFWGERFGQVIDPYGHRWGVSQHLHDVPPAEVAKAAAVALGAAGDD